MHRPIIATIHLDAMRQNFAVARNRAPDSKIWAVVKANGYGHGVARAMRGFSDADGLALNDCDVALRLRELGWNKRILLLQGAFGPADLKVAADQRFHVVVHCNEQIEMLEKMPIGSAIDVYLKLNTGMNRLGFPSGGALGAFARIRSIAGVRHITLMTHFSNSFAVEPLALGVSVSEQIRQINAAASQVGSERSYADSATVLTKSTAFGDWCRLGVMLYGATVLPGRRAEEFGLAPAMTLESEVIGIQRIGKGDFVGYGSRFMADAPMMIGIVACGYTDGYPRSAADGTPVLVDGVKTGVVGRVSMDSIAVDLTPIKTARIGSKVTLWGRGLPIEEVATAAGTIGCELMCGLSTRIRVRESE